MLIGTRGLLVFSCCLSSATSSQIWADLPTLSFGDPKPFGSLGFDVDESVAEFQDSTSATRKLIKLSRFLTRAELDRVYNYVAHDLEYATDTDSVDKLPTFEGYFFRENSYRLGSAEVFQSIVQDKLEPYVRQRYNCKTCILCKALARRYLPNERRAHAHHFDSKAYVTVVLAIRPNDYVGGLYIEPHFNISSRQYIKFDQGDAVFHQYDVSHGISVKSGTRFSVVFWLSTSEKHCREEKLSWNAPVAKAGDAVAQYNLGNWYELRGDKKKAHAWYRKSSKQGFPQALAKMGQFAMERSNFPEGISWFQKAADAGHIECMVNLGIVHTRGDGVPRDIDMAVDWYGKALEQDDQHVRARNGLNEIAKSKKTKKHIRKKIKTIMRMLEVGKEGQAPIGPADSKVTEL